MSGSVDRFTKKLFWIFKKCRVVSMEAYHDKQVSEKNVVPNVAPIASSGIILFSWVGSSWGAAEGDAVALLHVTS